MPDTVNLVPASELNLKPRLGLARLSKMAFDGTDLNPVWAELVVRLKADNGDAEAAMDLSLVAQLAGQQELGLQLQHEALAVRRLYRAPGAPSPALRVLAFMAQSDIGGNVPIEFLLEGSDIALHYVYVVPGMDLPDPLPDHDLAFVAVPDSDATRAVLLQIARLVANWPRPVINMAAGIMQLERDRLHKLLQPIDGVCIPQTVRVDRDDLQDIASGAAALAEFLADGRLPLVIRPVDSQAGRGLAKLDTFDDIAPYLAQHESEEFFLSNFIDTSGEDGLFRKARIVFIAGLPYACHMAIGAEWKLWYLNAGMDASVEKRAEEERFMARFDTEFAARHNAAFHEIAARVGLDYFGIDCAETRDGRLLIFEADIAMIVHDMDPAAVFPYKGPQMRKVFAAFRAMLTDRARTRQAKAA